jgi:hypothetical protein
MVGVILLYGGLKSPTSYKVKWKNLTDAEASCNKLTAIKDSKDNQ